MDTYIERLMMCGWDADKALFVVEELASELGLFALDEFIKREEHRYVEKV